MKKVPCGGRKRYAVKEYATRASDCLSIALIMVKKRRGQSRIAIVLLTLYNMIVDGNDWIHQNPLINLSLTCHEKSGRARTSLDQVQLIS